KAEATEAREALETEHAELLALLERDSQHALDELAARDAHDRAEAERKVGEYRDHARATYAEETTAADRAKAETMRAAEAAHTFATTQAAAAWTTHMEQLRGQLAEIAEYATHACPAWSQRLDGSWSFDRQLPPATRLGQVDVAFVDLASGPAPADPVLCSLAPESLSLPIMLDVANRGSLLIECDPLGRDDAIRLVQTILLRLLIATPPGRAKLTIFDPIGRGRSFAGLMRLADFDDSLVGSRIWTESRHMEARLTDLTEHIENVIQKYLRDDYASIDEYNRVAGEIAEPYRYLVIADFPANFTEDAAARLASIIDAGARCGVFVIMLADPAGKLPPEVDLRELRARAIVLQGQPGNSFRLASPILKDLTFTPDPAPSEAESAALLTRVGEEAQNADRVEVSYRVVEPPAESIWSRSCADELRIPIGRAGATKAQELRLGRGTSQHVLIAGKTGSGKSTLLHILTTAAMLWHAPSEVEFYLVDFKKGVEFKPYASGDLPHIRAVAIESDREFGLSILQRLDTELRRRGDLYREHGVQSLAQFRERFPDEPMPRSILIIDEFQEFFVEDDRVAQDASLLLDRLVRQGRAFGIHVLLASQTLSGAYSLARSTVGQMAVRIALKCSETDSYLILSEDNAAARLLSRPGEAIYNDANGLVEGNNPFQVAWLSDEERDGVLRRLETLAARHRVSFEEPVFFEGNAAADLARNRQLRRHTREGARPVAPRAALGDPVSIKDPTSAIMRRRGGANLLIVGQRAETAAAMLASSVISLAVQHDHAGPRAARFLVVDGTPEDDPLAGRLHEAVGPLPHDIRPVSWRDAPVAVAEAHTEMLAREEANRTDGPAIYLVLQGLHWLRSLRRKEDDFSFSLDKEASGPAPDEQLKALLIDGPRLGIFVLAWCDTVGSLTRALDRPAIAEFGNRVLMQMSANDSSMLIEATSAARLGLHRAIFFDEERGAEEKFRPYALPDRSFVESLASDMTTPHE
ncbi:DNA translocase FtsK, partial [hydrothermal vent metagenome]